MDDIKRISEITARAYFTAIQKGQGVCLEDLIEAAIRKHLLAHMEGYKSALAIAESDFAKGKKLLEDRAVRLQEQVDALTPFVRHTGDCGGSHFEDSLANQPWNPREWRDCTCKLADLMLYKPSQEKA